MIVVFIGVSSNMIGRAFFTNCHHCQLLWNSVGNSASAGELGSQRIPNVPGGTLPPCFLAASTNIGDQKSHWNPPSMLWGSWSNFGNKRTLPPAARCFWVDSAR